MNEFFGGLLGLIVGVISFAATLGWRQGWFKDVVISVAMGGLAFLVVFVSSIFDEVFDTRVFLSSNCAVLMSLLVFESKMHPNRAWHHWLLALLVSFVVHCSIFYGVGLLWEVVTGTTRDFMNFDVCVVACWSGITGAISTFIWHIWLYKYSPKKSVSFSLLGVSLAAILSCGLFFALKT